jgi:predicted Zn-dependent protease
MKHKRIILIILLSAVLFLTCETDPLTGETNFYLFSDAEIFAMSFEQYKEFLDENKEKIITGTDEAKMVKEMGERIQKAAEKWYISIGQPNYLKDYKWEYNLIKDNQVNAWCMPGGKIVVYTGILPVTENKTSPEKSKDALATVMGHEVAHALLNHGKQRLSWSYVQMFGAELLLWALGGTSEGAQSLFLAAYAIGTNVGLMLPFSRENESQADEYGLYLMAIADYNPDESVPFWQRMEALSGGSIEFLSTHPDPKTRQGKLAELIPIAKARAAQIGIIDK